MKRYFLLFLSFLVVHATLSAQDKTYSIWSELEQETPDLIRQSELRKSEAWRSFEGSKKSWYVEFNEITGLPHRAFGPAIASPADTKSKAVLNFLSEKLSGFNLPLNELVLDDNSSAERIAFSQIHNGLKVFGASAFAQIGDDNQIAFFGLDLHPNIEVNCNPSITKEGIDFHFKKGLDPFAELFLEKELIVVPVPERLGRFYNYHLAYEGVVVENSGQPAEWYTLVDAHNGQILYRQNLVVNCGHNHDHEAQKAESTRPPEQLVGSLYLTHPFDPISTVGLPYLMVESNGNQYFSDELGLISINSLSTAHFPLIGKYVTIMDRSRNDAIPTFNLNLGNNKQVLNYDGRDGIDEEHLGTYYHTNIIHDFMSDYFGPVTGLDTSISAIVKRSDGSCNAFYRGRENSINFYLTSNGCNALSKVADVIYHEYGHAINRNRYGGDGNYMINGGMNEGYADVWALSITKELKLGVGFSVNDRQRTVRRYDTLPKVYPQNYVNQVHGDGEIICGAWLNLASRIGYDKMMDRFTTIYDAFPPPDGPTGSALVQGQVYRDVLIEALLADDNDGDLANGTPNGQDIISAFAAHGISLLEPINMTHNPVEFGQLNNALAISAELNLDTALFWPGVSLELKPVLNFRDSINTSYNKVDLTQDAGSKYVATLPSRSGHGVVSYFISLEDTAGNVYGTIPEKSNISEPNLPYFVLYGYSPRYVEDFEGGTNTLGTWQLSVSDDDATQGMWEISTPIASHINGDTTLAMIQPGRAYDGLLCAVTQNAQFVTSPLSSASVDSGKTTMRSPVFDLSNSIDPIIAYRRWFSNTAGGYSVNERWNVQLIDGTFPFSDLEKTLTDDNSWRRNVIRVRDYNTPNDKMQLQFITSKKGRRAIVEAAFDAIVIYDVAATSVEQFTQNQLKVFPNPAQDQVQLRFVNPTSDDVRIALSDIQGRQLMQRILPNGITSGQVDLTAFPEGIYLLSIDINGNQQRERIVISR